MEKEYKISYSLFHESGDSHLSNCRTTVKAHSIENALEILTKEKLAQGWHVGFAVEGDMFEVTFEDLNSSTYMEDQLQKYLHSNSE